MKQRRRLILGLLGVMCWLGAAWAAWGQDQGLVPVGHYGGQTTVQAVLGNYVYLSDNNNDLTVLDATQTTQPQVVRHLPLPNITIANGRAYVTGGTASLRIYDLADPTSPTLRGDYQTTGSVARVAVDGTRACLVVFTGSTDYTEAVIIQILDVSDPAAPRLLGTYNPLAPYNYQSPQWPFSIKDMAVVGSRLFLAVPYGLEMVDIGDPAQPVFKKFLGSAYYGQYRVLAEADSRLYQVTVNCGDLIVPTETIEIFDLSDAQEVRTLGVSQRISGMESSFPVVSGLAVAEDKLYYGIGDCLRVVDVNAPATPRLLATKDLDGNDNFYADDNAIVAGDGRVYMSSTDGLHIFTLGDQEKGAVLRSTDALTSAETVTIFQSMAFVRDGKSLKAIRLDQPTTLPTDAELPLEAGDVVAVTLMDGYPQVFRVTGEKLKQYLVNQYDPNFSPYGDVTWPHGGRTRDIAVQRLDTHINRVGIVCQDAVLTSGTLHVFIVEYQWTNRPPGSLTLPHRLERVFGADGNRVLLAWQDDPADPATSGLTFVDVGDLANPAKLQKISEISLTGAVVDLAWQAPFAYVLVKDQGLRIVDFTDQTTPKLRGSYNDPAGAAAGIGALSIQMNGPEAWLACGGNSGSSIIKLDVSDPDHPALLRTLPLDHPTAGMDLALEEGRLYVVSRGTRPGDPAASRFEVLDGPMRELTVAGPLFPFQTINSVEARQGRVLIGGGENIFYRKCLVGTLDVSQPGSPALVDVVSLPQYLIDVVFDGRQAFTAINDTEAGLQVIDFSTPGHPVVLNDAASGQIWGVAANGGRLFTSGPTALMVYDISPTTVPLPRASAPSLPGAIGRLAPDGSLLAVATGNENGQQPFLQLYSVAADSSALRERGRLPLPVTSATGLALGQGTACIPYGLDQSSGGLIVLDTRNTDQPVVTCDLKLDYFPTGVTMTGRLAIVYGSWMEIYDLTDAAHPVRRARQASPGNGFVYDAALDGRSVYLAAGQRGLFSYQYTGPIPASAPARDWALYE